MTQAQTTPDELGKLFFRSFKQSELQSIEKHMLTQSQMSSFLKKNNLTTEELTKDKYEIGLSKFRIELESIYSKGVNEGIDWSKIELASVESDVSNDVALVVIMISSDLHNIEIKLPLNFKHQGKWYFGFDISYEFAKHGNDKLSSNDLNKSSATTSPFLATGVYELSKDKNEFSRLLLGSNDSLYINPNKIISDSSVTKISYSKSKSGNGFNLKIELDNRGRAQLAMLTENSMFSRIAFIFNNNLVQTPTVMMKIETGILLLDEIHLEKSDVELMVNQIRQQSAHKKK